MSEYVSNDRSDDLAQGVMAAKSLEEPEVAARSQDHAETGSCSIDAEGLASTEQDNTMLGHESTDTMEVDTVAPKIDGAHVFGTDGGVEGLSRPAAGNGGTIVDPMEMATVPGGGTMKIDLKYELYAVLVHSGSAAFGHYYALIKDLDEGEWHEFNDSTVRPIKESELARAFGSGNSSGSAYLLLYRRANSTGHGKSLARASDVVPAMFGGPQTSQKPVHDSNIFTHDEKRFRSSPPVPMDDISPSLPASESLPDPSMVDDDDNPYTTFF